MAAAAVLPAACPRVTGLLRHRAPPSPRLRSRAPSQRGPPDQPDQTDAGGSPRPGEGAASLTGQTAPARARRGGGEARWVAGAGRGARAGGRAAMAPTRAPLHPPHVLGRSQGSAPRRSPASGQGSQLD